MTTKTDHPNKSMSTRKTAPEKTGKVQSSTHALSKQSSGPHVTPKQSTGRQTSSKQVSGGPWKYCVAPRGGQWHGAGSRNNAELVKVVKEGLPVTDFEHLRTEMDVSTETLSSAMNIAPRTLARRKKEGKLQQDESERLLRIVLLYEKAKDVLEGDENARRWLKSPKKALGGKTPLEYADTEPGAREVERLLGRIEHGVFS